MKFGLLCNDKICLVLADPGVFFFPSADAAGGPGQHPLLWWAPRDLWANDEWKSDILHHL